MKESQFDKKSQSVLIPLDNYGNNFSLPEIKTIASPKKNIGQIIHMDPTTQIIDQTNHKV